MIKFVQSLKYTSLYDFAFYLLQFKQLLLWYKNGKPLPTPHIVKQSTIKDYAKKFQIETFIETGTYMGSTTNSVKNTFKKIYTIELDEKLYQHAKKKFHNSAHIKVSKGDSSKVLPTILKNIKEPCLFWLDAHYSKGITAKSNKDTPIIEELGFILDHPIKKHIILIDDADCFNGTRDFPTINYLKNIIKKNPDFKLQVKYNIIRITPLKA